MKSLNRTHHLWGSLVLALALLLGGCSSTDSDSYSDPDGDTDPGPTVNFNSGDIAPDETYSYTFEDEGDVDYYCQYHEPDMQGTITVNSSVEAVERDTVFMDGTQFNPVNLSIAPNTEVVWVNKSNFDHTVTSGTPDSNDNGDY